MKKFFAYARVSSQEQADKDLSIPAQVRAIRKFAHDQRLLIEREFTDVESAKEPGRKHFSEMMAELKRRPDIEGVICHKLDRLLRNLKDYADVDDFMRIGKQFLFTTEHYDETASGKLALGVRVLFAKHYLDNLSEEVKKGLNERMLERGKWSFVAPPGYLNVQGEILVDPQRAPLIRKAFEMYATGDFDVEDIADFLYLEGLRSRGYRDREGGKVYGSRIHATLRNPFYYGMMRFRGQVIRGTHEPLITKALFDRVQDVLEGRNRPRAVKKWFAYRGLLVCGECGRAVTAETQRGHVYYRCTKSFGGAKACSQPYVREESLNEQFAEQIAAIELGDEEYAILRDILKQSHQDEQEYRTQQIAHLQRLKAQIQKKQDALLDRLLDETISREVYDAKFSTLEEERQAIEPQIVGHEQANRSFFEQMENFLEAARRIHRLFVAGTPAQKRQVVQLVASNGVLTDKKAYLNLKEPCAILANRGLQNYGSAGRIRT